MILTTEILNKILNSDFIKNIYPMIDHIKSHIMWDGDETYPMYDITLKIYVNDPDMTASNMYDKGLDPHYLIDKYMILLIKFLGSARNEISQIYVSVIGPDGEIIYGI
jgi:hypothetical protein